MKELVNRKYKILEPIGKGQFGQVFLAVHIHSRALVALKQEPIDHRSLKHETTVLHYLNKCKRIPQVLWYGIQDDFRYLAITYCEGESLDKCGKTMTFQERGQWWNQAITCLEHIHASGIIHRDIKPFHFVQRSNEWILIDFGLATTIPQNRFSETIVGSPNYVSYFVHEGLIPTIRDDLISLMYVFWELLFGQAIHQIGEVSSTCHLSSDSIHTPYNQWLKAQKEWSTLYSRTVSQDAIPEIKEMMTALLKQGEQMPFTFQLKSYSFFLL
jgi:serine/threonine protein kinase